KMDRAVDDIVPSISIVENNATADIVKNLKPLSSPKLSPKQSSNQKEAMSSNSIQSSSLPIVGKTTIDPKVWVMAPEFIPRQYQTNNDDENDDDEVRVTIDQSLMKTYAQVVGCSNLDTIKTADNDVATSSLMSTLCPYLKPGETTCRYGDRCVYEHEYLELCDLCGCYCLDPTDKQQRKQHHTECIQQHENEMELAFAISRSRDKSCGICFEVIMEKAREQRFGILPNCNHIFCLECIRKWRQEKQFETKIIRACPECRTTSDFVCPSAFWVDTKDDKDKLLADYKKALEAKQCKYFKQGDGTCPFGNKCFYKHALKNGKIVDVGLPPPNRRHHRLGDDHLLLWDFMQEREHQWFDDLASFIAEAESEDSEIFELDLLDIDPIDTVNLELFS
ncbi:E3 ubiquitin-protein ligase makorin-1, partial [Pseudolycoriella hygida]